VTCLHCFVWFGQDDTLFIGCAHCNYVKQRVHDYDHDLLQRQVTASRDQHARLCNVPARRRMAARRTAAGARRTA